MGVTEGQPVTDVKAAAVYATTTVIIVITIMRQCQAKQAHMLPAAAIILHTHNVAAGGLSFR